MAAGDPLVPGRRVAGKTGSDHRRQLVTAPFYCLLALTFAILRATLAFVTFRFFGILSEWSSRDYFNSTPDGSHCIVMKVGLRLVVS
jgi:hypothetical protein